MEPERARQLRRTVLDRYRAVAARPAGHFPYPVGRESARGLGYEEAWLAAVPPAVVDRFVGVGNPFRVRRPAAGARVLDLGCGAGLDVFVASLLAGPTGRAAGVELTPEMLAPARAHVDAWPGVEFHEGSVEDLPFGDAQFDLVLSNGALNLVPDKDAAFREAFRVLRPGGAFVAADVLVMEAVPDAVLASMDAWST